MQTRGRQQSNLLLFILALEFCRVQGCWTGSGPECEKAAFVPGHNLAGEGFDVVRMRRTGAYVINVKAHLADNRTCTLCSNRFQQGKVQNPLSFSLPSLVLRLRRHTTISLSLRFRGSRHRCWIGVPSVTAVSSFPVRFTTLWTPCCAAPTPWLRTTGVWV